MSVQVTVNNITGSTPYQIFICDSNQSNCIYVSQITSGELPYNFTVPPPYDKNTQYCLKVIDKDNCTLISCFNV